MSETETAGGLAAIEDKCRLLRQQRNLIGERLAALDADIQAARTRHIDTLRDLAAAARQTTDELMDAVDASAALFEQQRTMTLHQIKFGFRKARGSLAWDDEAKVVSRIKSQFTDEIGVLLRVSEKPNRAALSKLAAGDLKRLGVEIVEADDEVVVSDVASDIDKAVDRFINEQSAEAS